MQEMTFFFYGTLMNQTIGEILERTPGRIRGQLWDLGPFPAAIEGEGVIKGMIIRANVPEGFLHVMDRYEGFYGEGNPYNYYERKRTVAISEDGEKIECWVYFFADKDTFESAEKQLLENGDWLGMFDDVEWKGELDD